MECRKIKKKIIVLSGINLFEGGPLSIYYDCLEAVKTAGLWKNNRIIAFVHKKELFQGYRDIAELVELPDSRKSYINRLYYEYVYFYEFSRKKNIDVWFSLHDITPRVKARRIYTYCHNPSPFMKKDISKLKYSWKIVAFSWFYQYLYRVNIRSATAVIVQQEWIRREFLKMYPVRDVIVAYPNQRKRHEFAGRSRNNLRTVFIYAAYPRFFKNYEVILKACSLLEERQKCDFEVWLTLDGNENRYSAELKRKYRYLNTVKWMGLLSREALYEKYDEADCMIFPSKLETWGLPISEFKDTGKPIILADLPYAHETLGTYSKSLFFEPSDYQLLARYMYRICKKSCTFTKSDYDRPEKRFAENWDELIQLIM